MFMIVDIVVSAFWRLTTKVKGAALLRRPATERSGFDHRVSRHIADERQITIYMLVYFSAAIFMIPSDARCPGGASSS